MVNVGCRALGVNRCSALMCTHVSLSSSSCSFFSWHWQCARGQCAVYHRRRRWCFLNHNLWHNVGMCIHIACRNSWYRGRLGRHSRCRFTYHIRCGRSVGLSGCTTAMCHSSNTNAWMLSRVILQVDREPFGEKLSLSLKCNLEK